MTTAEERDAADWRAFNVWLPAIARIQHEDLTADELADLCPRTVAEYQEQQAALAAHVRGEAA